jgi:hypothetical protein
MTDVLSPEDRIDNLCRDVLVAGYLAKDRRLTPAYADALATRVRSAAHDMLLPHDGDLLRATATTLERASLRVKTAEVRPRVKAAAVQPPPPSQADLVAQWDS